MLANIAVPIQSMIDTAIVGRMGMSSYVAALGLSAQIIMLLIGSLYFLQASTAGLSAQVFGQLLSHKDLQNINSGHSQKSATLSKPKHPTESTPLQTQLIDELSYVLLRAIIIALCLAMVLMVSQTWLVGLLLNFFDTTAQTNLAVQTYLGIRFYSFPAELANYAFFGWFAGIGKTRFLLVQQLVISLANVFLSLLFVYGFNMTLDGVATGTVIAQYLGLFVAGILAYQHKTKLVQTMLVHKQNQPVTGNYSLNSLEARSFFKRFNPYKHLKQLVNPHKMRALFALNGNILLRSILLTVCFTWITKLTTMQGETFLASNVILLYILTISSFALDGIAMSAKTLVGQTYGSINNKTMKKGNQHNRNIKKYANNVVNSNFILFVMAIRRTAITNMLLAVGLSLVWLILFPLFLDMMTNIDSIKTLANQYKYFACLLPLIGAMAYWLDGVFFGLTDGQRLRNSMLITTVIFIPSSYLLTQHFAMLGVWLSIYLLLLLRALVLVGFLKRDYL